MTHLFATAHRAAGTAIVNRTSSYRSQPFTCSVPGCARADDETLVSRYSLAKYRLAAKGRRRAWRWPQSRLPTQSGLLPAAGAWSSSTKRHPRAAWYEALPNRALVGVVRKSPPTRCAVPNTKPQQETVMTAKLGWTDRTRTAVSPIGDSPSKRVARRDPAAEKRSRQEPNSISLRLCVCHNRHSS